MVRRRLAEDSLVYAGYSAGACLLGPAFPGRNGERISGLGIVPFTVIPHAGSRPDPDPLVQWFVEHDVPYLELFDGEAVIVDADGTRVVGSI